MKKKNVHSFAPQYATHTHNIARKIIPLLTLFITLTTTHAQTTTPTVLTGIDILIRDDFAPLKGKRIGLITNPTGITADGQSTVNAMRRSPNVKLIALYGPEHGVYGDQIAGGYIPSITDPRTGLKAWSLYGPTRKPSPEMLQDIDTLVYDIQDIGCRSYTYISTLGLAMEAAAEAHIEFIVLDRPNPLGGNRIEGPALDPHFKSFVGQWPIPYVYGLTPGEIARMIAGENWIKAKPKLTIIPMQGWKRDMLWNETGLKWVPTSPHIPTPETALHYVTTGWIGELGTVNNGVGYPLPFALLGMPEIKAEDLATRLNNLNLPGLWFRPAYYKPFYSAHKDKTCGGIQIYYTDPKAANLSATGIHLMKELLRASGKNYIAEAKPENIQMFDKVCGSDQLRKDIPSDKTAQEIIASWKNANETFAKHANPTSFIHDKLNLPKHDDTTPKEITS